jgi:Tfp pilus assembly protein PilO
MTNKEKYLLMFLAGLIVIAIYWFAIYSPLQDKTVALKSEVQTLNDELTYVYLEYAKKDSYEEETTNARAYIQEVNNRFPAGLTQEAVIYTMKSLEEAIDSLTIQSYTIGDTEVIIQNEEYTSTEEETGYERVVKVPVNVNFQTSYNDYKKILSYIQTYPTHLSLGNMTANSVLDHLNQKKVRFLVPLILSESTTTQE